MKNIIMAILLSIAISASAQIDTSIIIGSMIFYNPIKIDTPKWNLGETSGIMYDNNYYITSYTTDAFLCRRLCYDTPTTPLMVFHNPIIDSTVSFTHYIPNPDSLEWVMKDGPPLTYIEKILVQDIYTLIKERDAIEKKYIDYLKFVQKTLKKSKTN